ncbi:histidine phosphatase superfamily [Phaeosphaeriaceae sp. PMI808]|nr:histidine phosphatase superfamily [Phaeosphaeriaceae sp. PMI808]
MTPAPDIVFPGKPHDEENEDEDDEEDVGETSTLEDLQSSRIESEDESHSNLPRHTANALFPPFYNRPPTPLPPSPSLTSLLRPPFASRPSTPDSSDPELRPKRLLKQSLSHSSNDNTSVSVSHSIVHSARHATPVPRAAPKVPTYEYYGFALYLGSSGAFLAYVLWAYAPARILHGLGITYYPNRWWALAIPSWLIALIVYIYVALASYNTGWLTLGIERVECVVDECAQVGVVERRTGRVVGVVGVGEGDVLDGYRFGVEEQGVAWGEFWSVGTDAVMDVPVGGWFGSVMVCHCGDMIAGLGGNLADWSNPHMFLSLSDRAIFRCSRDGSNSSTQATSASLSATMRGIAGLSALALFTGTDAAETILGAFIFHRHGDRTPKALAPTNLTALGYEQVYTSGQYYRSRYLSGDSKIRGINQDIVKLSQISVTAPVDNVLQNSATGFLQGFYPPVQTVQVLANGKSVQAPMDGYQLIPVNTIAANAGSEDAGWLQDASSCHNAKISSNSYFESKEYADLASSTKDFYASLVPSINNVISADQVSYKNGYIVYDILNVATIQNTSIPNPAALSNSTLSRLSSLASQHEYGLAYNATDPIRAIAGMQLAAEILSALNATISSKGAAQKLSIQFGAYATFLSFFGLADLPAVNPMFKNIVDYASSMAFELYTTSTSTSFPDANDLRVRFLFHNGVPSNSSSGSVTAYPLFGGSQTSLPWTDFAAGLRKFAVGETGSDLEYMLSDLGSKHA